MYRTWNLKHILLLLGIFLLAAFLLFGTAGRVMRISAAPRELPIYCVDTQEKKVALGFNCAWDDQDIDSILQTLDEKNVKATFFLVGSWCETYPKAAKKIADAGHELGSHSQTHPDMTKLSRQEIEKQLADSKAVIEKEIGQKIRLFRAPSGAYNNLTVSTARALGWEVIQWDCDTLDWKKCSEEEIILNAMRKMQNGSIVLLHAGAKNTAAALPKLIDRICADGYELVPIGELIYTSPYEIDHTGRQRKK